MTTEYPRRTVLKASSALAAAAVLPAAVLAAPDAPDVLALLLAEYRDAIAADRAASDTYHEAEFAFTKALSQQKLWLPPQCAAGRGAPWLGHTYSGAVDPWTAADRLKTWRAEALANPDNNSERIHGSYRSVHRHLNRQLRKYREIRQAYGLPKLDDARTASLDRVLKAKSALEAYRPTTVAEIAEIVRAFRAGPSRHGSGLEWTLAKMLNIEV